MNRTDIAFTILVWIGSLMFFSCLSFEFGIIEGQHHERQKSYQFKTATRAFLGHKDAK